MGFEIERARALYRSADRGVALLPPASARCIRAARTLYSEILDRIEAAGYDVFTHRATVPTWRKAALAGRLMLAGLTGGDQRAIAAGGRRVGWRARCCCGGCRTVPRRDRGRARRVGCRS